MLHHEYTLKPYLGQCQVQGNYHEDLHHFAVRGLGTMEQ
jgi:hypothetical protein